MSESTTPEPAATHPSDASSASVFRAYSAYYDLLYRDKDYAAEVAYIEALISRHHSSCTSVLDLGCGTGRHALLLAEHGYRVAGVDLSAEMLTNANMVLSTASSERATRLGCSGEMPNFFQGDIRSVRLQRKFDVVVSLFHVMSYQTANSDLEAAVATAKAHLEPGGTFVFDCWYGPAVLTIRPSARVARFAYEHFSVTRLAEPVLHAEANTVDVNYQLFIKDGSRGSLEEIRETHTMRYLFTPEVSSVLNRAGFRLESAVEFMTDKPLGFDTWTAVFVAKLVGHSAA